MEFYKAMSEYLEGFGWAVFEETPSDLKISQDDDFNQWVMNYVETFIGGPSDNFEEMTKDIKRAYNLACKEVASSKTIREKR